jgi:hypothetical protein
MGVSIPGSRRDFADFVFQDFLRPVLELAQETLPEIALVAKRAWAAFSRLRPFVWHGPPRIYALHTTR